MGQFDRQPQSLRKHGPLTISGGPKAPRPPPSNRPEWRGLGHHKKRAPRAPAGPVNPVPTTQAQFLPVELQQLLLNIFRDTFLSSKDFDDWKDVLTAVNEALVQGNLERAFGEEEKKQAYALRWSPSRALAYANVMAWLCDSRAGDAWVKGLLNPKKAMKVVSFGGGAAEIVALGGLFRHLHPDTAGKSQQELDTSNQDTTDENPPLLDIHLIDSADWSSVTALLNTSLTSPPPLSKYASAAARASNASLLSPSTLQLNFTQTDIFNLKTQGLETTIGTEPAIITFFLTLNDLYTTSIPKTTTFLRKLELAMPKNSLLLVIDTIGASSSTAATASTSSATEEVTTPSYPMDWLLDRILLGPPKKPEDSDSEDEENKPAPKWEKVVEEKMKLHKLDEKLWYPGSLENLKFQICGFKRL